MYLTKLLGQDNNYYDPIVNMRDQFDRPLSFVEGLPLTINNPFRFNCNYLHKYFEKEFVDQIPIEIRNIFEDLASTLSFTPLVINDDISRYADTENLYLKQEYENTASQSFKDRGTFSAILFLLHRIGYKLDKDFYLGTVSLGNMAISTSFIVDRLYEIGLKNINSFIVINKNMEDIRISAIQRAAVRNGTTIFKVDGNYAAFHDITYQSVRDLQSLDYNVYAQLTDDIYRAAGYFTLFAETLEQFYLENKSFPDFILVPTCSGACVRAADYAIDLFIDQGFMDDSDRPTLVIVQESGADPIYQGYKQKTKTTPKIKVSSDSVAVAISSSNARSGDECLEMVEQGRAIIISVDSDQIKSDHKSLDRLLGNKNDEIGSNTAVTALKVLRKKDVIKHTHTVVIIRTGLDEPFRDLMKNPINASNKIIDCSIEELNKIIIKEIQNEYQKHD